MTMERTVSARGFKILVFLFSFFVSGFGFLAFGYAACTGPGGPARDLSAGALAQAEGAHLLKRFRCAPMLLAVLVAMLVSSAAARAACSNPSGAAGDLMYNSGYHVPQYCDGTNWVAMGPQGAGGSGCGAPSTGLVGWWKFDEASGTSAADATGNGNTGTLTSSNASFVAGEINNAISLSNVNTTSGGLVAAANPSNFAFAFNHAFTLAAWVYHSNSNTRESDIMGKENPANSWQGYSFWIPASGANNGNNSLNVTFSDGTNAKTASTNTNSLTANTWHHVVETYDGSGSINGVKVYVDAVNQSYGTSGPGGSPGSILVSQPLQIGGDGDGDGSSDSGCCTFNGKIDDARVYNRALSSTEVTQLYNATSTSYPTGGVEGDLVYNGANHLYQFCDGANWQPMGPTSTGAPTTGLVGYWKFDDGSGTSAADSSGNGNTGTLQNAPTWTSSGMINGALTLNGTSQYVSVASTAALNPGSITVSAWFKLSATPSGRTAVVEKWYDFTHWGYGLEAQPSTGGPNISFTFRNSSDSSDQQLPSGVVPTVGVWYHAAATYDSSTGIARIYVNGVLQQSLTDATANPLQQSSYPLGIGVAEDSGSWQYYFPGVIDDVRVYNVALTASQVLALYNGACYEGDMMYNSGSGVMQYCNGTAWVGMGK